MVISLVGRLPRSTRLDERLVAGKAAEEVGRGAGE